MFQSTLPRRERLGCQSTAVHVFQVSIHAPTKGATNDVCFCRQVIGVSIHAPTKGATGAPYLVGRFPGGFNPRSHEGSDAPYLPSWCSSTPFQSTLPRRERRQNTSRGHMGISGFNPRSHEGSDHISPAYARYMGSFNPRSHEGSDHANRSLLSPCYRFQSTLPRRERLFYGMDGNSFAEFQSTLPRRERHGWSRNPIVAYLGFNPRSHEGSDRT